MTGEKNQPKNANKEIDDNKRNANEIERNKIELINEKNTKNQEKKIEEDKKNKKILKKLKNGKMDK